MTKNEILAALRLKGESMSSFARLINANRATVKHVIDLIGKGKIDADYFNYVKAEGYQRITNELSSFLGKDVLKKTKKVKNLNYDKPIEQQV